MRWMMEKEEPFPAIGSSVVARACWAEIVLRLAPFSLQYINNYNHDKFLSEVNSPVPKSLYI
jgi:hypothetical protein